MPLGSEGYRLYAIASAAYRAVRGALPFRLDPLQRAVRLRDNPKPGVGTTGGRTNSRDRTVDA